MDTRKSEKRLASNGSLDRSFPVIRFRFGFVPMACALAAVGWLLLAAVASSAEEIHRHLPSTFYVAPDGSDRADGDAAHPWHTLQHAANWALPGDTIVARSGVYAGFVLGWDAPQGGTADAPITYRGEPGATIVSRNGKTPDGIDLEANCGNTIFEGFVVNNASGSIRRAGIRITESNHVKVIGNTLENNGTWGVFTSHSSDLLIENNTTSHSGTQHGIYVSNSADRVVIRNNRIFANSNCGIHMNGDASQGGSGIISRALVEDNIIYDNGAGDSGGRHGGGSAINCDGVEHSIIRCNLLYNNHSSGISLYHEDGAEGSKGNIVVNNTIVMAPDARWAININNDSTGNTILNNILFDANMEKGSVRITGDSLRGFISDHNIVEDRFSSDDRDVDLATWREKTGQDQNSRLSTPQATFAGFSKGDFRLAKGSPAVGAGATGAGAAEKAMSGTDLQGNPWGGPPDIGAYHFRQ
jgi:parallel beta-helix repeat protein